VQYSSQTVKELGKNKTLGQFEVVGKGWDGELGGVHFDMLLTELLAVCGRRFFTHPARFTVLSPRRTSTFPQFV
jgi:hypothetical protein